MHYFVAWAREPRCHVIGLRRRCGVSRLASVTFLACAVAMALLSQSYALKADTSDATWVKGNAPFAGKWGLANNSDTTPAGAHHRIFCRPSKSDTYSKYQSCSTANVGPGDWAVDFYGAAKTDVIYNATVSSKGTLTAQVWAIMPSCTKSDGGSTVIVDVYVNGSREGFISYTHLDAVSVSPGKWINPGQKLGKLKKWAQSDCYNVRTDAGVHTHIEMFNVNKYACYYSYKLGDTVSTSLPLGQIGRMIYTARNTKC
jgi:hypothetical protein